MKCALAGGEQTILEIVMSTHAGMTTQAFEKIVIRTSAGSIVASTKGRVTDGPSLTCGMIGG
jgi:hypothetical protein